jgi:DNA-binding response OmpR family regulator
VIVADGSPSVRKAVELSFPESEFELFFFDNGQDLARSLPDIRPDALLVGLSLPGLDGYRAAALLRGTNMLDRAAIFFLRGSFEAFDEGRAAGLDHEEVVRKPFDSVALSRRLKSVLDRNRDILSFPAPPEPAASAERPAPAGGAELSSIVRKEVDGACAALEERIRAAVLRELAGRPPARGKTGRNGRKAGS